jgi:hypothetical protein
MSRAGLGAAARRGAPVALLAALLLAGCGSSGDFASKIGGDGETTSGETPAQLAAASPQSPAEAARSVNLRAEDFPYLKEGEDESSSPGDPKAQREFDECAGGTHLESELASAQSPTFNGLLAGQFLEFSSETEVFGSEAAAERVDGLLRGKRVFSCFARLVGPALEDDEAGTEVEILSVKTHRLRFPDGGIPGGFGFRVQASVAPKPETQQLTDFAMGQTPDGRGTLTVYMDILVFISGRFEVNLTASGSPHAVPPALERNLLRLLRSRAAEAEARLR